MSRPRRLSTSSRVALAVTAVLAAGLALLSVIAYTATIGRLRADIDRTIASEAEAFSAALGRTDGTDVTATARSHLQSRTTPGAGQPAILLIRLASGKTLSNSDVPLEEAPENAVALAFPTASRGFTYVTLGGEQYRAATVPIFQADGAIVAVFEAAVPTGPARDAARQLGLTLAGAAAAVLLIGFALSAWVARASLRPLRDAAATAETITDASLGRRVPYEGPDDEVGTLVCSLNDMLDRLELAFGEQRRFVADASHELRTPLAVIKGHLELLQRIDLDEADRREALEVVTDELDRMSRLVTDLLALARLEGGVRRPHQELELATLVQEAVAKARGLTARRIEIVCEGSVWVEGDPDQLLQALLNVLVNAVDHTGDDDVITVGCRGDGDSGIVSVADTGPGLGGADAQRVFDRFYRGYGRRADAGGGSGLGLAISERLVELHGGAITAADQPEGGAIFTMAFPRVDPTVQVESLEPETQD